MDLVIDANVLFAALIRQGAVSDLLFDKRLTLFAPDFIEIELRRHKGLIVSKTAFSDEEVERLLMLLRRRIEILPLQAYEDYLPDAESFSPDKVDAPYFALALKLGSPLWTNDKALREQQAVRIVSTRELFYALRRGLY